MSVTGLEAEQDASRGHTAQPNTGHSVEVPEPVQVTGELFQQELCQLPTLESSQEPIHLSLDRCSLGRAIQDGRGHIGLQGGMALGDLIQCHCSSKAAAGHLSPYWLHNVGHKAPSPITSSLVLLLADS